LYANHYFHLIPIPIVSAEYVGKCNKISDATEYRRRVFNGFGVYSSPHASFDFHLNYVWEAISQLLLDRACS